MRPHDARSSVSIWRLSFAVFGLHSYPEQLYSVPSLIAFTLKIFNWANTHSIHEAAMRQYQDHEFGSGNDINLDNKVTVKWFGPLRSKTN